MAKFPVYNFRYYLAKMGMAVNTGPVPLMDIRLSPAEIEKGKTLLQQAAGSNHKVISIFTYATGDKCYGPDWWEPVYKRLKTEFPDYTIIEILPLENASQIGFKAPVFSSRDIREVASVIANTVLFIGADSGVMHLASASQTPTVGLFNITDEAKYGPYGNNSIAVNTDHVTDARYDHIPEPFISRAVRAISAVQVGKLS
jgi:ADP-heptose:LPS heptosyltransferase